MKQKPWTVWTSQFKSPKYVLAPMVNQSDMAFRILTKRHGAELLFTPMIHARLFVTDIRYRQNNMPRSEDVERPLIAQFCGSDADMILEACRLVQEVVDGVDLNCGCPQGIARRGEYGSYLLKNPTLVKTIAAKLVANLEVPVSVKIRLLEEGLPATIELVKELEKVGVSMVTVHARTMHNKGHNIGPADWDAIKCIVASVSIPIIANGNVSCKADADRCLEETGAAAVMSAEAILENPGLFSNDATDVDDLMAELCCINREIQESNMGPLKAHLWHSLHMGLKNHTDLRDRLVHSRTLEDIEAIVLELRERRKDVPSKDKLGWYFRHCRERCSKDKENRLQSESEPAVKKARVELEERTFENHNV